LTKKAIEKVKETMASQPEAESYRGIRLSVVGGGCSGFQYGMKLQREEHQGDQVIQADGFNLYVDQESLPYLTGTEIDYMETVRSADFKFNNPNVKSTCGCGKSFQTKSGRFSAAYLCACGWNVP
jgi:iron-sulfur cluster assembly protein